MMAETPPDISPATCARSREDAALQHVTSVAQRTIDRLQRTVAEKEAALARATRALTDARAEGMRAAAEARAEVERLSEALQHANEQAIQQYRKVLTESDQRQAVRTRAGWPFSFAFFPRPPPPSGLPARA